MSSSAIALLGLTVGLPCVLLALAILYHARRNAGMPAADEGWYDDAAEFEADLDAAAGLVATGAGGAVVSGPRPSPFAADPMFIELQETVGELQGQLARQRAALAALLSDQSLVTAAPAAHPTMPTPLRPGSPDARSSSTPNAVASDARLAEPPAGGFTTTAALVAAVQQLNAEGLSERAIARRLRVGVEEIRLAGRQRERVS